jgi:hypothetical protein
MKKKINGIEIEIYKPLFDAWPLISATIESHLRTSSILPRIGLSILRVQNQQVVSQLFLQKSESSEGK